MCVAGSQPRVRRRGRTAKPRILRTTSTSHTPESFVTVATNVPSAVSLAPVREACPVAERRTAAGGFVWSGLETVARHSSSTIH